MNLIIVADRGGLKAFKTSKERDEKSIELLEQSIIEEMLGVVSDKMSDVAGNFPIDETTGKGHVASEKMTLKIEYEKRAVKKLIKDIESILKKYQPAVWDFAASSDINGSILDHLEASLKVHLRHNLKKDLMKTPQGELARHFEHA